MTISVFSMNSPTRQRQHRRQHQHRHRRRCQRRCQFRTRHLFCNLRSTLGHRQEAAWLQSRALHPSTLVVVPLLVLLLLLLLVV